MIIKQSDGTAATLHNSEMIAKKMGHNFISPEHLLLAIATYDINSALQALRLMGVSADDVQKAMNYVLKKASPLLKSKNSNEVTQPKRMASTERIIRAMELEAKAMGLAEAHTAHILLGILRCRHSRACQFLEENNIRFPDLPMLEDNLFVFNELRYAHRVKCIPDVLYDRRIREGSIMTAARKADRVQALSVVVGTMMQNLTDYKEGTPMFCAVAAHI